MKRLLQALIYFTILNLINSPIMLATYQSWDNTIILSNDSKTFSYRANIVVDSFDTIHVVWKDKSDILNAGKDWDLFYKYKTKNGNWSDTLLVTTNSINDSNCLSLAIDKKNTLHLVWKDKTDMLNAGSDWDIFYKTKPLNEAWSSTHLISVNSTDHCSCPKITIDYLDVIHIIWADSSMYIDNNSDTDIMYVYKQKDASWSKEQLISTNSNNDTIDPAIIVDKENTVHVVWYESVVTENQDIIYTFKKQQQDWSLPVDVSTNCTGISSDPSLAVDTQNNLHLVWMDTTPLFDNGYDYDVFYRLKPSNSSSWNEIELISDESNSNCKWPFMIIDQNDAIYVTWADQTPYDNDGTGDYDIVIKRCINSTWSKLFLITDESRYDSNWPRCIVDSSEIMHMTWWDEQPGRYITYYDYGSVNDFTINTNDKEDNIPSVWLGYIVICLLLFSLYKKRRKDP